MVQMKPTICKMVTILCKNRLMTSDNEFGYRKTSCRGDTVMSHKGEKHTANLCSCHTTQKGS